MKRIALILALLMSCLAVTVRATSGGATVCDVLGWDDAARRVYIHEIPWDGAGAFGDVFYIECTGARSGEATSAGWVRRGEQDRDDPGLNRQLDSLRAALRPLIPIVSAGLPWRSHVVTRDTLQGIYEATRFLVQASFGERDFVVSTWHNPNVFCKAVYALPGLGERLVILSFTGKPEEGGYEVQAARLVAPGKGAPIPVSPRRYRD